MERNMSFEHAIVIGGSVAGLTAARALSESFERVTIVERDVLPDGVEHRPGVPQAKQLHVILPLGVQILDELFPGFEQQLRAEGCPSFDEVKDTPWFGAQGWRARQDSDVQLIGFRRPLLEQVIRRRVRDLPNVEVFTGTATGLLGSGDRMRVTGVWSMPPGAGRRARGGWSSSGTSARTSNTSGPTSATRVVWSESPGRRCRKAFAG
jgi:2-polyprenyl-6-methoxyphenol hydroxylase-like FAD-dependent oxidoreductase